MIKRDNDRALSMLAVAFICTDRANLSATPERDGEIQN
jgi:hypothetical protein